MQHKAIGHQQHNGDREHTDDREVELAAGVVRDRLMRLDLALALQSFRRELIEPCERDPEREPNHQRADHPAQQPGRRIEHRQDLRHHLREQPRRGEVESAGAKNIAAPQFGEQAGLHAQSHSPVPEAIRSRISVGAYLAARKRLSVPRSQRWDCGHFQRPIDQDHNRSGCAF
jgi:hypothetical protein